MLKGKTVVIGVSGGIAVYKACDVVSRLKKLNANVHVIMTKSATEFVTPLTFQSLSQNYVVSDMFEEPKTWDVEHISLAKKADVFLIAPATANVIGKVANGIADDMLTTTVMATTGKVLIAPAMNTNMYRNPILQRNISILKELGYNFVDPDSGRLACGDIGEGKLASPEKIVDAVVDLFNEDKKDQLMSIDYNQRKLLEHLLEESGNILYENAGIKIKMEEGHILCSIQTDKDVKSTITHCNDEIIVDIAKV